MPTPALFKAPSGYVEDTPSTSSSAAPTGYIEDNPAHSGVMITPDKPAEKPGFWNTFLDKVNPIHSIPALAKSLIELPDSPFYHDSSQAKGGGDEGYALGVRQAHGQDIPGYGEIYGNAAAMGANAALLAAVTHGLVKGGGAAFDSLTKANPVKDLATIYPNLEPQTVETGPRAIADIKKNSPVPLTSNEHLASVSPDYAVGPALKENRDALAAFHNRAQNAGIVEQPDSILQATEDSLKEMKDPVKKQKIIDEIRGQLSQQPLDPNRVSSLLEEKNGELKSFYDRDPAVQAAARAAGADTGRSQALLDAQAKALRKMYNNMLDPENAGEGPKEIQNRYGAIKNVTSEANAKRLSVQAETAGTMGGKLLDSAADLLNIPGKTVTGDIAEPFKNIKQTFRGTTDPIVERIFKNAPDYTPLPTPNSPNYPTKTGPVPNTFRNGVRQLEAGPVVQVQGGGSPASPDTSYVKVGTGGSNLPTRKALPAASTIFQGSGPDESEIWVGTGASNLPAARALPEASTRFQGDVSPSSDKGTIPKVTDSSFVKSQVATPAVAEKTLTQVRDEVSSRYMGRKYSSLSNGEKVIVDKLQQGRPLSISDLSNLGGK